MKKTNQLFIVSSLLLSSVFMSGCSDPSYNISFRNYDFNVLYETSVKKGSSVIYEGQTPTRPEDDNYTYTFKGWDKPLENIVQDTIFVAQYDSVKKFVVTFQNYDGSFLYQTNVKSGGTATYKAEPPVRKSDSTSQYAFTGWDKPLENITADTVITAQYKKTNDFVVHFYSYDGNTLVLHQTNYVKSGESVTYKGDEPTKAADFDYYYTFNDWDKAFDNVTSNLDVFACFEQFYNVKDFDPSFEYWIYKFSEDFDDTNTSFYKTGAGLEVELAKPVIVDGVEKTSHHVNFTDMVIDFSNVDTSKIGEYDTTITYQGITKNEVIDVIPDSDRYEDDPVNSFSTGGHNAEAGPDWIGIATIDFYKYKDGDDEEYAIFNDVYSEPYLHDYFEKDDHRYMTFYRIYNGVSINFRYKLRYVGGGSSSYIMEYDFPEHEDVEGTVKLVSNALTTDLVLHKKLDESHSAYGQISKQIYTSNYKIAVKYDYDAENNTIKVHHPDFPNVLAYDAETNTYK